MTRLFAPIAYPLGWLLVTSYDAMWGCWGWRQWARELTGGGRKVG